MAPITIEIPNISQARVESAFNSQGQIALNIVKQFLIDELKNHVIAYEKNKAILEAANVSIDIT